MENRFLPGEAVIDDDGYCGIVAEYPEEPLPTPYHVFVRVGKNHPQAWQGRPVLYASDRLRKIGERP